MDKKYTVWTDDDFTSFVTTFAQKITNTDGKHVTDTNVISVDILFLPSHQRELILVPYPSMRTEPNQQQNQSV
jgi:hypothetical protein